MRKLLLGVSIVTIVLLGGCEQTMKPTRNINVHNDVSTKALLTPKKGVINTTDALSGTLYCNEANHQYIQFEKETNVCFFLSKSNPEWYASIDYQCLRNSNDTAVDFDFNPFITAHTDNYTIDFHCLVHYAILCETTKYYEKIRSKLTTEDELKKNADDIAKGKAFERQYSSVENYRQIDPTEKHYKETKQFFAKKAAALKAITPVKAELSEDKQTLTVNKMLIGWDNKTDKPIYAENIVFTRKK